MAEYTAIADVGRTLVHLLRSQMTPDPIPSPEMIGLASPADKGDLALSLFLYEVQQNGLNQQQYWQEQGNAQTAPPMALDLHFLLTAHSNADLQTRALDEHRIIGRALQVLYDNQNVRGSMLQGALADSNEEFRVLLMEPLSLHTAITLFPNQPYKLSYNLIAGPVYIDSGRNKPIQRVLDRQDKFKGIEQP
ncbi:DUF4255 domain-containing protein [Tumebacillus permanentifrigoris]|uniref:Uncharacterized protein DUF4255 n=1 Tax=Tumebacillus permanentifrigoris TaxID=378543 RepID=A0A316D8I4_9BACL|nr:DUF4255 domain-containing protein [Tumebacillus permanentifrigoris]PWK11519.1 uncharacterized protein DUF4255 [Tumebacillus permanentifrigoris]